MVFECRNPVSSHIPSARHAQTRWFSSVWRNSASDPSIHTRGDRLDRKSDAERADRVPRGNRVRIRGPQTYPRPPLGGAGRRALGLKMSLFNNSVVAERSIYRGNRMKRPTFGHPTRARHRHSAQMTYGSCMYMHAHVCHACLVYDGKEAKKG